MTIALNKGTHGNLPHSIYNLALFFSDDEWPIKKIVDQKKIHLSPSAGRILIMTKRKHVTS
jgi:hypothetical protein